MRKLTEKSYEEEKAHNFALREEPEATVWSDRT